MKNQNPLVLSDQLQPVLLDNQAASVYLGVSPNLLRLSRHTGELFKGVPGPKYLKLGSAIRYPKANLDNWIESQHQYASSAEVALAKIVR